MPLPESNNQEPWPPKRFYDTFCMYAEWAAWYGGDPDGLASVYGGYITHEERPAWWRFWQRAGRQRLEHQARTQLHVPLAGDIAATSASLLFAESPVVTIPQAHEGGEATLPDAEPSPAEMTEQRLLDLIELADIEGQLLEAAETGTALGGVFLKVDWDKDAVPFPFISVVQADQALPEFRYRQLTAVTIWHDIEVDKQTYWRHVERHESGIVYHGLYKGRADKLGERLPLTDRPETENLLDEVNLPFEGLAVRYIPNMRPNRRYRSSVLGQSDYAGAEGLLDALDECWTSWMRDIRLGKGRIFISQEMLEGNAADGYLFSIDREVYVPLDTPGTSGQGITISQFAIRVDEHERTAMALMEQIVNAAGYSPQSFGLHIEGRAESGTALRLRERKSLTTQQKKRRFWETPLADLFELLLIVDQQLFSSGLQPFRPQVTLADSLTETVAEVAATVELINRAGAASKEVLVRMLHPEWSDKEVLAEVERLRGEQGMSVPDPMEIGVA